MITVSMAPYGLFPVYDWEESDRLISDTLSVETETKYKEQLVVLQQAYLAEELTGNSEQDLPVIQRLSFLKGKMEVYQELLNESQEAKTKQYVATGQI